MNLNIVFSLDKASESEISEHLWACNTSFMPHLSHRVSICNYAHKIINKATRFEAWVNGKLIGFVAAYYNDPKNHTVWITNVSVLKTWARKGIATYLINWCIGHCKLLGMKQIRLEVANDNTAAIMLYKNNAFITDKTNETSITMHLYLINETVYHD